MHTKSMVTILIVCILLFKLKLQLLATTKNDYIVLRADIFRKIKVLYIKVLIFNGSLYYKINNKIYKRVSNKSNTERNAFPKLSIDSLSIYTTLNNEDYLLLLGGYGAISTILKLLPAILTKNIIIKHYHTLTVPIFDKGDNSVQINAEIGFGLIKFIVDILANKIKRRIKNRNTRFVRENNI